MHADPHPGNLVVDANTGALTYLDFGMTVTVDARRRSAMLRGLVGFVNRDARSLVRDLVELEFLPRDVDQTRAAYALSFRRCVFKPKTWRSTSVTRPASGFLARLDRDALEAVPMADRRRGRADRWRARSRRGRRGNARAESRARPRLARRRRPREPRAGSLDRSTARARVWRDTFHSSKPSFTENVFFLK